MSRKKWEKLNNKLNCIINKNGNINNLQKKIEINSDRQVSIRQYLVKKIKKYRMKSFKLEGVINFCTLNRNYFK